MKLVERKTGVGISPLLFLGLRETCNSLNLSAKRTAATNYSILIKFVNKRLLIWQLTQQLNR